MVEKRTARQATFYDRGLGTGKLEILAATCGIGISNNILECYRFIYDNYNEGDRIFLFGFSRGAVPFAVSPASSSCSACCLRPAPS